MLVDFFFELHRGKVPVSIREFLDLLAALNERIVYADMEQFYFLSRTVLVKDEKHFDKFDQAFKKYFDGLEVLDDLFETLIPDEWLRKEIEKNLSKEELDKLQQLGDFDKLMEEFKKRLEEQKKRHQGGNKWIGTARFIEFDDVRIVRSDLKIELGAAIGCKPALSRAHEV